MVDPNQGRALEDLGGEVDVLPARLADLEKVQPRRRLGRWAALVGLVSLVGGTAWAASGTCPNDGGVQFCFTANSPAVASQINYNFSQLRDNFSQVRDLTSEAWAFQVGGGVPTTTTMSAVATVAVPAGSYVVTAKLYAVSGAAASNRLGCAIIASTATLDFTNSTSGPSQYSNLSVLGTTTLAAPGTITFECSATIGAYSLYRISLVATRVGALH